MNESPKTRSLFSKMKKFGQKSPTVLLVDDDADQLNVFRIILERANLNVLTANCAFSALMMLDHKEVSLIVCDVNMPEMSGRQLVSNIRKSSFHSGLPVISISADCENTEEDLLQAGADCYIQKSQLKKLIQEITIRVN